MIQNQTLVLVDNGKLNDVLSELSQIKSMMTKEISPNSEIGGIELAEKVTGLKKSTVYVMVHKNTIPFIKQGGKLYFKRSELISWIESGRKEVSNG